MKIYLCAENLIQGMIEYQAASFPDPNAEEWRGVTVFGEHLKDGSLHPLTKALLEKARELADADNDKAQLLLIGDGLVESARDFFAYGTDRVFVYDDPGLASADAHQSVRILAHFIDNYKPSAILFPQTELCGRLASCISDRAETQGHEIDLQTFTEPVPLGKAPDPAHRGELVICEIPDQE